ncbi:Deoxyribonuclease-1 [Nymphon striatum]|nr:Deoxyribonuclease-1 [Nymphon striatum]
MHLKIILVALMSMLVIVESDEIRIGAYNVLKFGKTFWSNPEKAAALTEVVKKYDLIVIQEIVEESEASIYKLMYRLHISDKLNLLKFYQHTNQTMFERPPLFLSFEWMSKVEVAPQIGIVIPPTNPIKFSLITMHASADTIGTDQELNSLAEIWLNYKSKLKNSIIIGDLNADCSYVTDSDRSELTFWTSSDYSFLIGNDDDTTTESTHCAYDRIIYTGTELESHLVDGSNRVYKFEDFEDPITTAKLLSDHCPVEVKLKN